MFKQNRQKYEKLWKIMKNMKKYEKLWKIMKNYEKLWKIMKNYEKNKNKFDDPIWYFELPPKK